MDWTKSTFPATASRPREERIFLHYRAVFMANNEFNRVFGTIVIPFLKLDLMLVFVSGFFACARLFSSISLVSLFLSATVSITTIALLIPTSIVMSRMFDLSLNFHVNLSSQTLQITEKQARKVFVASLKSCQLVRCKIGNWYYMEGKAKLTMLHNVLNGLAYLLINAKA